MAETLNVSEIFFSIQGEGTSAGLPCVLIRLSGCNLRCDWCDTKYAWAEGKEISLDEILHHVERYRCPRVELTGGEPLLQKGAQDLLRMLCDAGYQTLVETNGSRDISKIDPRATRIVDFKCPSSGQNECNLWENVRFLRPTDEVKFVIADRADYDFAVSEIVARGLKDLCPVILQPVFGRLQPTTLAEWMLQDPQLPANVRLGLQLHKVLWPGVERGV